MTVEVLHGDILVEPVIDGGKLLEFWPNDIEMPVVLVRGCPSGHGGVIRECKQLDRENFITGECSELIGLRVGEEYSITKRICLRGC